MRYLLANRIEIKRTAFPKTRKRLHLIPADPPSVIE